MQVFSSIPKLQSMIQLLKNDKKCIAFVPTMGNLHAGHLSLIDTAKKHADIVIVSIFVNPLQFAPNEDFDEYPRTEQQDLEQLQAKKVDFVFMPDTKTMYPVAMDESAKVVEPTLTKILCGISRPHFFTGVTTIVAKLFNIIKPDVAIFGEKDFQQYCVIRKMVAALNYHIKIISSPIVRNKHGLALSSRNKYLSENGRLTASKLYGILLNLAAEIQNSDIEFFELRTKYIKNLRQYFIVDYLEILDYNNLQPADSNTKKIKIFSAVILEDVRLIDNITV